MKYFLYIMTALLITVGHAHAGTLPDDPLAVCPLKVSQKIPQITLKDIAGKTVNLNKEIAKKPTILIFYRGGWCPYCNIHLGQLKTIEKDLEKLGYQMIAVSPDTPKNLTKSIDKNEITYTLLSDSDAIAAKALGLAYKVDDKLYKQLLGYNINIEEASGEKHRILPVPAAIVLDKNGEIMFTFVSPNYKVRVNTDVLLVAAKAAVEK